MRSIFRCIVSALVGLVPALVRADSLFFRVNDNMRIKSITEGFAPGLWATGWALGLLAFLVAVGIEQLKVFEGKPPQHGAVISRALVVALALTAYGPFCQGVWDLSRSIAESIADDGKVNVFALMLKTATVQAYTALTRDALAAPFSLFRNAILACMMDFMVWGVSWAIDAIRVLQVLIFNFVFLLGPICLALHIAGLRTGQLWLTALLEICTWNVTIAIVVYGLEHRVATQFIVNAGQDALQFDWWRDMKEVTFLALSIFSVPIITARFFGFAALGELSKTALGSQADMALASAFISAGAVQSTPRPPSSGSEGANSRRAGD